MTLLLFLTGLTTTASTGGSSAVTTGLFAVSGGQPTMQIQATQVSYAPAPLSARTE